MSQQVKTIPDGYHTMTPGLTVRDAARAIEFYQKAFNAQQLFRMDSPDGKVMHAELKIGNSIFMLAEENPAMGCASPVSLKGTPISLYLYVEDADAAFAQAVKAGATVVMPVTDMFWGDRHGQVTDPFGHRWSLATRKEDVSPQELEQRAQKFFAQSATAGVQRPQPASRK